MQRQKSALRFLQLFRSTFVLRTNSSQALTTGLERTEQQLWSSVGSRLQRQQSLCFHSIKQDVWDQARHAGSKACPTGWTSMLVRRLTSAFAQGSGVAAEVSSAKAAAAAAATAVGQASSPSLELSRGLSGSTRRQLVWWLGGCSAWVFSMVVLGGVTRLTRSGLSMTDWKFTGEKPPVTQVEWQQEFAKYQQSPEFRLAHSHMTLDDFKFIYYMEWAHRMWGRVLGVAFAVPAAYFAARGYITRPLAQRLGLLFVMGGAQGLVGWWMVRSGLQEPENQHQVPRVSPYRLAAHLTSAFAIYTTLVWTTLDLAKPTPVVSIILDKAAVAANPVVRVAARQQAAGAQWLRARVLLLSLLVGITAISGAFVAGNDAGRAYNTFPLMNGQLIPDEYWSLPGLCNAFENTAAVQLHHRGLALSTLAAVSAMWLVSRKHSMPRPARLALDVMAALTAAQVALGVTTLLTYVPVSLGSAHQAGALTLFTAVLTLMHTLRPASSSAAALAVSRLAPPLAVAATAAIGTAVAQTK